MRDTIKRDILESIERDLKESEKLWVEAVKDIHTGEKCEGDLAYIVGYLQGALKGIKSTIEIASIRE